MIDAISQLLESPVAYHAVLAKALRSVPAAVMLSQGIYWQRQAEKAGRDTFWMTIEGWYEQTGITPESQNTARRVLRNAGFWHEMLVGMPAKTHYRIDVPALVTVITGYLETGQQVTVDHRNKPRVMPRTSHGKFRQHSTVIYRKHETPETSFETSFESSAREKIREKVNGAEAEKKTPIPNSAAPLSPSWSDRPNADTPDKMRTDLQAFYEHYSEDWKNLLSNAGAKYEKEQCREIVTAFCAYQIENNRTSNNYRQTHAALQRWFIGQKAMRQPAASKSTITQAGRDVEHYRKPQAF